MLPKLTCNTVCLLRLMIRSIPGEPLRVKSTAPFSWMKIKLISCKMRVRVWDDKNVFIRHLVIQFLDVQLYVRQRCRFWTLPRSRIYNPDWRTLSSQQNWQHNNFQYFQACILFHIPLPPGGGGKIIKGFREREEKGRRKKKKIENLGKYNHWR